MRPRQTHSTMRPQPQVWISNQTGRPTRETLELRMGPVFEEMASVLAEPFRLAPARRRRVAAAIRLCLSFPAWRALRAAVKSHGEAVEVAVRAVTAQVS